MHQSSYDKRLKSEFLIMKVPFPLFKTRRWKCHTGLCHPHGLVFQCGLSLAVLQPSAHVHPQKDASFSAGSTDMSEARTWVGEGSFPFILASMDSTKRLFLTMIKCPKSSLREEGFMLAYGSGSVVYRAWHGGRSTRGHLLGESGGRSRKMQLGFCPPFSLLIQSVVSEEPMRRWVTLGWAFPPQDISLWKCPHRHTRPYVP